MNQDSNQNDDPTSLSAESGERKIIFAPGCFDNFEGTQEELQELLAEIQRLITTGEFFEQATPLSDEDMDDLLDSCKDNTRQ